MQNLANKSRLALTLALAVIIALPVFYLIPETVHQKYRLTLDSTEPISNKSILQFYDLNNNGWSERIYSGYNPTSTVFITITGKDGIVDQWNFPGEYPTHGSPFQIADHDNNGFKEIYAFVLQKDSLWLYWFEPMNQYNEEVRKVFIDRIMPRDDLIEIGVIEGSSYDMNDDGYDELIFGVWATFSANPRKVFIYDIHNNELRGSERFGAGMISILLHNFDDEEKPGIIVQNSSYGNTSPREHKYHDNSCWIMVFNHDLQYRFDPVEIPGKYNNLYLAPFNAGGNSYLAASHSIPGRAIDNSILFLFNSNGEKVAEKKLPDAKDNMAFRVIPLHYKGKKQPFLINPDGELFLLDTTLNLVKKVGSGVMSFPPVILDIDDDGSFEKIFVRKDQTGLRIYREDFRQSTDVPLPDYYKGPVKISAISRPNQPSRLAVSLPDMLLIFHYSKNPFYPFHYIFYVLVLAGSLGFIVFIQFLTRRQMQRRISIERQLSTLQINNVLNQLDPHFTFNTLHSIGSYILREQKDIAYEYLIKFSRLIRSGLSDAEAVCRSVSKELEIATNYLELQKHSYSNKFDYAVDISESVDMEWDIPKMILQVHVENALKHGLLPGNKKGMIKISFDADARFMKIVVEDNGIGRLKAANYNGQSTRKGIKLFERFISFFNSFNTDKITQEIVDLYNPDGTAQGTKVLLTIPIHYNYSINDR